jgi:hypothetical protein
MKNINVKTEKQKLDEAYASGLKVAITKLKKG